MSLLHTETVTVWCEGGVPYGIVWAGRHYRVTDTPTHLEHHKGWRFQGTDDDELSRIFDIRKAGSGWELVNTYE